MDLVRLQEGADARRHEREGTAGLRATSCTPAGSASSPPFRTSTPTPTRWRSNRSKIELEGWERDLATTEPDESEQAAAGSRTSRHEQHPLADSGKAARLLACARLRPGLADLDSRSHGRAAADGDGGRAAACLSGDGAAPAEPDVWAWTINRRLQGLIAVTIATRGAAWTLDHSLPGLRCSDGSPAAARCVPARGGSALGRMRARRRDARHRGADRSRPARRGCRRALDGTAAMLAAPAAGRGGGVPGAAGGGRGGARRRPIR